MPDSVTSIGAWAFSYRRYAVFSNDMSNVVEYGDNAFSRCSSMNALVINDQVTELPVAVFANCSGLEGYGCSGITEVTIPVDISYVGEYSTNYDSFYGCNSISTIKYTKGSTGVASDSLWKLGLEVCGNYNEEGTVKPKKYTVEFADGIKNLANYNSPETVCTNLESVKFGKDVETIGSTSYPDRISATFYGKADSFVETYANQKQIKFIAYDVDYLDEVQFSMDAVPTAGVDLAEDIEAETAGIDTDSIGVEYYIGETAADGKALCNTQYSIKVSFAFEHGYRMAEDYTLSFNSNAVNVVKTETGYVFEYTYDKTGHGSVETKNAKASTCTEAGYTGDSCCSLCGAVLASGEKIDPNGHTIVTDTAVAPTCTQSGLTEGKHCSICGEILVAQEDVEPNGHTSVTDAGVDATCTTAGITEGSHCSVCGEILVPQIEIEAKGHTVVVDPAVPVSGVNPGYTEGSHCSVCGEILVPQETINPQFSSGFSYVEEEGEIVITGYNGTETAVIIPNVIDGKEVTRIEDDAFRDRADIESVVIPDSIQKIGSSAFMNCSGITEISLPADVDYMGLGSTEQNVGTASTTYSPGNGSFEGCTGVTKITYTPGKTGILPDLRWNNRSLAKQATNLETVVIKDSEIVHLHRWVYLKLKR